MAGGADSITVKAAKCIETAEMICIPQAQKEKCRAYLIAEQTVPGLKDKECLAFDFKMTRNDSELERMHQSIYQEIRKMLLAGKTIAFLTIGDPTIYSTFMYIAEKAGAEGFPVEIVSGIPSFVAAAASFGIPLCEKDEELHIGTGQSDIEKLMRLPGTKVIMKPGKKLPEIKSVLRRLETETKSKVYAISDCGWPNEVKYCDIEAIPDEDGYMTTIIVKDQMQRI